MIQSRRVERLPCREVRGVMDLCSPEAIERWAKMDEAQKALRAAETECRRAFDAADDPSQADTQEASPVRIAAQKYKQCVEIYKAAQIEWNDYVLKQAQPGPEGPPLRKAARA